MAHRFKDFFSSDPFVIALSDLAIALHIAATRHFEVMCAALQRSHGLREELRGGGAFNLKLRLLTVSAMAAGLIWPSRAIRRGWLDPDDYKSFPVYLRRRMKIGVYFIFIGMSWIAFVAYFVEFKRA